jgi:4-aminobutyrate aminotransferase
LDEEYIAKAIAFKYYPLVVARTEGSKVWDIDGNEYIDFLASAALYNVGHRHPEVVKAIREQLDRSMNYTIAYLYEKEPVELAMQLAKITPGGFKKKVTFGFTGSDAVDSSIKIARAYTKRKHIISFKESYHGTTYGALSVTGIVKPEAKEYVYPIKDVHFVDFPDPYRNPWGIDGYEKPDELTNTALDHVEKKIRDLSGDVAAVITEPIQGDAGVIIPPPGFIKGLKELTEKYGAIYIDEEVQSGMGRTGKWWAIEHFNTEPDLLVTAKALGGGMPVSAVIGKAELMDSVPPPLLLYTHIGHVVSAVAALTTIKVITNERLVERANEIGGYVLNKFREIMEKYNIIGDVRGKGLMIGIDIVKEKETKEPDRVTALKICWRSWERGLILITFGKNGNVLRIAPPLNIPRSDLEKGLEIIEESLKDVLDGKVSDEVAELMQGW